MKPTVEVSEKQYWAIYEMVARQRRIRRAAGRPDRLVKGNSFRADLVGVLAEFAVHDYFGLGWEYRRDSMRSRDYDILFPNGKTGEIKCAQYNGALYIIPHWRKAEQFRADYAIACREKDLGNPRRIQIIGFMHGWRFRERARVATHLPKPAPAVHHVEFNDIRHLDYLAEPPVKQGSLFDVGQKETISRGSSGAN